MFKNVQSVFRYAGPHREILLRAKDGQDPTAIAIFSEVYGDVVRRELLSLIRRENIRWLVVPRMSLQRIVRLNWHPNDLWKTIASEQSMVNVDQEPVRVYMRAPFVAKRRAQLSSRLRRQDLASKVDTHLLRRKPPLEEVSALFVDDVLTSGGTLIQEWQNFVRLHQSVQVRAHVFTLFRTPLSDNNQD
jgi:predicted amidophosphoribosyltransferase